MNETHLDVREPVMGLDKIEKYPNTKTEKEWMFTTEAIRRRILSEDDTRKMAAGMVTEEVNEKLPEKFLFGLEDVDPLLKRLGEKQSELAEYLSIDAVPDKYAGADIKMAKLLFPTDVENEINLHKRLK